jgi:hypothetical protein
MACLTYFPSPVGYQGLSVARTDLIETKRKMLNQQLDVLYSKGLYNNQLIGI